jgi:hypothetical protein
VVRKSARQMIDFRAVPSAAVASRVEHLGNQNLNSTFEPTRPGVPMAERASCRLFVVILPAPPAVEASCVDNELNGGLTEARYRTVPRICGFGTPATVRRGASSPRCTRPSLTALWSPQRQQSEFYRFRRPRFTPALRTSRPIRSVTIRAVIAT